jgi:hypothetical protein
MAGIGLGPGERELYRATTDRGGTLYVTTKRLLFQPASRGSGVKQVALSEIRSVDARSYGLIFRHHYASIVTQPLVHRQMSPGFVNYVIYGDIVIIFNSKQEAEAAVAAIQNAMLQFGI